MATVVRGWLSDRPTWMAASAGYWEGCSSEIRIYDADVEEDEESPRGVPSASYARGHEVAAVHGSRPLNTFTGALVSHLPSLAYAFVQLFVKGRRTGAWYIAADDIPTVRVRSTKNDAELVAPERRANCFRAGQLVDFETHARRQFLAQWLKKRGATATTSRPKRAATTAVVSYTEPSATRADYGRIRYE